MSDQKVVHIPADIHRQLRIIAAQKSTSVRALVAEAVMAHHKILSAAVSK